MAILAKRFSRFGLGIHPKKTKLIRFGNPCGGVGTAKGNGTFDFLGFIHYWARSHIGNWVVKRKTRKKSIKRFLV
jgi:hypothetical protein